MGAIAIAIVIIVVVIIIILLFIVLKKNWSLCFSQDLQPNNKVMIHNAKVEPNIVEFVETFVRRSIYLIEDL